MSKKEQLHAMKDKIPKFYLPENRVDKNMRKPSDPNYDPSSIHIPPEEFKTLTDGMKRFWELKKDNMDKLILYRFGDWYVLYYDDRELASKIIELSLVNAPGVP
jgi:DNA mismatch repair protein MSH6